MLVSIIIPVYKTEKYLRACIDSAISQSYTNIEILLIDDGSPDNCGSICDEYSHLDKRIKVFHTANHGLSDARNLGIDKCSGQYVTFLDSDDRIDCDFIETLVALQKKHSADIIQCNRYYNNELKEIESDKEMIFTGEETQHLLSGEYYIPTVNATCKLINIKLFENMRFESGRIHEDEFIIHRMLYYTNKLVFVNRRMYCVNRSEGSITRSEFSLKKLDYIAAIEDRLDFYKKIKYEELYAKILYGYVFLLKSMKAKVKKAFPKEKKTLRELKQKMYKSLLMVMKNKNLTIRNKVSIFSKYIFKRS